MNSDRAMPLLTPRARDVLKLLAFTTMVIDHIGTATGYNAQWLHAIGRTAFPLFALVYGCNLATRGVSLSSVMRLWGMASVAQPVFWLAFHRAGLAWYQLNILFTFAVVSLFMYAREHPLLPRSVRVFAALATVCYLPLSGASYGVRGLWLMWVSVAMFRTTGYWRVIGVIGWLLSVVLLNQPNGNAMILAGVIFSTTAVVFTQWMSDESLPRVTVSRYMGEGYVLHLAILGACVTLFFSP